MTSSTTAQARGRLPVARRDRRPVLAALAILLILLGALGSALIVFRAGDRIEVLTVNRDVKYGEALTRADFSQARVSEDTPGVVPAAEIDEFVGTSVLSNLPDGALINRGMFAKRGIAIVPSNGALVGITLDSNRRPAEDPTIDQVVRLYAVSGSGGAGGSTPGDPLLSGLTGGARVADVSSTGGDALVITVLVPNDEAGDVVNAASTGNVALAVLPDNAKPDVDWAATATGEAE